MRLIHALVLASAFLATVAVATGCATSGSLGRPGTRDIASVEREPASSEELARIMLFPPEDALQTFVRMVQRSSSLGEDRAAGELVRIFNSSLGESRFSRFGFQKAATIEEVYRMAATPAAQRELISFFRGYNDFSRLLSLSTDLADHSYAGARERFLKGGREARKPASPDHYFMRLEAQLRGLAKVSPGLRDTVSGLLLRSQRIWNRTRLRVLGPQICSDFRDARSLKRLAEILDGVEAEVASSSHALTAQELDLALDRSAAKTTGEALTEVRQNRICPLIIQCGALDRSRGQGCQL